MRQKSSNVIVDDYQSCGYGIDSEMDAQDMDLGDTQSAMFIEGESEYGGGVGDNDLSMDQIREHDEEINNSMDGRRSTFHKKHKSLDGFEEEEDEETPDQNLMSLSKTQKDNTQNIDKKKSKMSGEINIGSDNNNNKHNNTYQRQQSSKKYMVGDVFNEEDDENDSDEDDQVLKKR